MKKKLQLLRSLVLKLLKTSAKIKVSIQLNFITQWENKEDSKNKLESKFVVFF